MLLIVPSNVAYKINAPILFNWRVNIIFYAPSIYWYKHVKRHRVMSILMEPLMTMCTSNKAVNGCVLLNLWCAPRWCVYRFSTSRRSYSKYFLSPSTRNMIMLWQNYKLDLGAVRRRNGPRVTYNICTDIGCYIRIVWNSHTSLWPELLPK